MTSQPTCPTETDLVRAALRKKKRNRRDLEVIFGMHVDDVLADRAEQRRASFRRTLDVWICGVFALVVLVVVSFFAWHFNTHTSPQ